MNKENFFIRQTTLENFGQNGQEKLQQAKIAIVGCGGLGSIAAVYLAASGIGQLTLIDFDTINNSNLHRQVFYTLDTIGKYKAIVLAEHIKKIAPFTEVKTAITPISKKNIDAILKDYSIILDCTDNLSIKYLLNDYCVINDKTLVYGSLYKYDGYVATFNLLDGNKRTANLRDAFPEMPTQNIPNCSESGTLNTIVGFIGLQQANEVLKIISGIGSPLINQILIYNSLSNSQFKMKLKPTIEKKKIQELFLKEEYSTPNCDYQKKELLISKNELQKNLNNTNTKIISVIEDVNTKLPFNEVTRIPLSKLKENPITLNKKFTYILICNKGKSSYQATLLLKEKYPLIKILSLKNGISNY
ncbi:MAG TPA: molybdopterin biosynthesis protein MoeB [Flavobacteriia bacterium]|nr:molybdopterin biosynthesis protein MoeB [Flavobacteriia bacterium]